MNQVARQVESALATAGRVFGANEELTGVLVKETGIQGPEYAPTGRTTARYDFVGIWGVFTVDERISELIEDGDARLEIGASTLKVAPAAGDKVIVQGKTYNVKMVETIRPGGVALMYRVTVRE